MGGMVGGITQGVFATIAGAFAARSSERSKKEMQEILSRDPKYAGSPYAKDMLGLAQNRLNSRMAGAGQMERNIYGNQANTISATNRYATDSSQATSAALAAQGQGDQAFQNMQLNEAADMAAKVNNLSQESNTINEANRDDARYTHQDDVRRFGDEMNLAMTKYKMRMAGAQGISNYGSTMASSMQSSLGGITGGGGGGGMMGGMSDKRLKHNYYVIGKSKSGINIYEFSYIGSNDRYIGAMAQEVPQAAFMTDSGYYAVDYSKIDVDFKQI